MEVDDDDNDDDDNTDRFRKASVHFNTSTTIIISTRQILSDNESSSIHNANGDPLPEKRWEQAE
jgi:hypothetical protein